MYLIIYDLSELIRRILFSRSRLRLTGYLQTMRLACAGWFPDYLPPNSVSRVFLLAHLCRLTIWFLSVGKNRCAWALILVMVAGCSHSPLPGTQNLGVEIPKHWSAPGQMTDGTIPTSWLKTFHDLKVKALVEEALAHNYDLQATAARLRIADVQAAIAGAARQPLLEFQPRWSRERTNENDPEEGRFIDTRSNTELLLDLSWELDVWGRIRSGQRAAEEEAEAAQADLIGARLSLAARTAQAWFELIEARLQVAVAKESVEETRTFLELLRGRFQRGLSRAQEVHLLQIDLSTNEFQLAQRHDEYGLARRRLEVLLGRYPAGLIETVEALPPFPAPLPAGLPLELLARRPDLIAALTRLKAAGLRVEEARAALLPRIQLTSSGGVSSEELNVLLDPKSLVWSVAGGLLQPILNGGRLRNEIRLDEARVEEALAGYRSTVLTAFREVEDALTTEAWLSQQERRLAEATREAEASVELTKYAFRMGNPDLFSLLDSLRSLLDTRSQHLVVRRQLLSNRISLYLALGGGA